MSKSHEKDVLDKARRRMLANDLKGRDITDPEVLRVMTEVPREAFMPPAYYGQAYSDKPLPIGSGQTISQPYIVALMTQALRLDSDCDVLEIGTGSGYQTAVLSQLARKVYTIETIVELSARAQETLAKQGVDNVAFRIGDGSCGWPEARAFDRIIVTAAAPETPEPLRSQLVEGGLLVAPIGGGQTQALIVAEKRGDKLIEKHLCGCRFVRLIGAHGFKES